jgi:hypothetical protein
MPDLNGKLSDSEKEKILKWVKEKSSKPQYSSTLTTFGQQENMRCQVCGSRGWGLADHIVTPTVLNATGVGLMNPSYPQAMLLCNECGSTIYVNVARFGLTQA